MALLCATTEAHINQKENQNDRRYAKGNLRAREKIRKCHSDVLSSVCSRDTLKYKYRICIHPSYHEGKSM